MKIEHENLNETEIKVTLEMTREDWEPYQDKKLTELAKTLKVPGFRPGKVPKAVVLNQLGKTAVENETLEETIHELYRAYLTDKQITVLGRPTTNIINQPIDGRDPYVKVEFTQEAFPEIKLPDAKTVQIQVDTASEIESKLFDTQIQTLREKFATLVAVDRKSKADDYLSIDLKAFQNGQEVESSLNQSIRLNADALVMENMFKNLLGTKAGDVKKFQSTLVGGDHAGESADIEVTVNSVKQMDLPELNDDFAKLSSQYTTYKEQEASLKKSAQDRVKETQINQASQKLMEHLDT
ncbi:MAG: trigger factor, partial [Bifidobacteriaceae bacterium]|nr:trigger factor [Bifidobacteriaceae bacterium]